MVAGTSFALDANLRPGQVTALAAGHRRWRTLNVEAYRHQAVESGGFWMSFHELVADYPWLSKRMARVTVPDYRPPSRHPDS